MQAMTTYDIPGITRTSLLLNLTPWNINELVRKTVPTFPFNQDKINDTDFAPSYVTEGRMETDSNEPQPSTSSTPLSIVFTVLNVG